MARRLRNWIDSFENYTSGLPSPDLFRTWGGIACIAGALERKVWVRTNMGDLYPNLYTVLVGPAGVGKTVITKTVGALWAGLDEHHLASASVSKASLMDELRGAERKGPIGGGGLGFFAFNSLKILANELGVLIPGYDNDFMNVLTDLYDGHGYSERRRSKDLHFKIDKPQINLLAATTPSYLNNVMPDGAWEQGFISRVFLIYSGQTQIRSLFGEENKNTELLKKLEADLTTIGRLCGGMTFSKEAADAITEWHMGGGQPAPDHPRLQHYNTRRTAHLIKLCTVASASDSDTLEITIDHFAQAFDWLAQAEENMPDIFKAISSGGDSRIIEETWHFVYKLYMKEKAPILAKRIFVFVQARTPSHNVEKVVQVMEKAGYLEKQLTKGSEGYIPKRPD